MMQINTENNVKRNYLLRLASAIVIFVIFLIGIFYLRGLFHVILLLIASCMFYEWGMMTRSNKAIMLLGAPIISLPIYSLFHISAIDQSGWILFAYFCVIWTVDTMAMVGGRTIKGPKIAPRISPNKTFSGLITGALAAVITANIFYSMLPQYWDGLSPLSLSIYTIFFAFLAQLSDLFISIFKRKFNIKDSGAIIPGHGGVLDRFDSIILTAPILLLIILN